MLELLLYDHNHCRLLLFFPLGGVGRALTALYRPDHELGQQESPTYSCHPPRIKPMSSLVPQLQYPYSRSTHPLSLSRHGIKPSECASP